MDEISEKIKNAAFKEFLEKGYEKASMRSIAKAAEVTTGSFYSRFENKDALYRMLFEEPVSKLERLFEILRPAYYRASEQGILSLLEVIETEMDAVTRIVYTYYDLFRLMLMNSHGSSMEHWFDDVMEKKISDTAMYFANVCKDEVSVRILLQDQYETYRQFIRNGYSKDEALGALKNIILFQKYGWKGLARK